MLISREKFQLAKNIEKTRYGDYEYLYLEGNRAFVINPHFVLFIEDNPPDEEDFPVLEGIDFGSIPDKVRVKKETALKVLKNLPSKKFFHEVLRYALFCEKGDYIKFGMTDLDDQQVISQKRIDSEYPAFRSFDKLTEVEGELVDHQELPVDYLLKVLKAFQDFGAETIAVRKFIMNAPVVMTAQKEQMTMTGVVTPMIQQEEEAPCST